MENPSEKKISPTTKTPQCWRRWLKRAGIAALLLFATIGFLIKDHVRTLYSLRRVPGTDMFVMDYYVDYHIDKIRDHGMDVNNVEDSFISTLFPSFIASIATRIKSSYVPDKADVIDQNDHHCSTAFLKSANGDVFLCRNHDCANKATLILRVHDQDGAASIAVINLAYLNLDREDLHETGILTRLPLLFSPYYLMDGMNRYGVAVSDMSVSSAKSPMDAKRPSVVISTLMRLILDYAKNTDEAVELIRAYNIHFLGSFEHLMISDAQGQSRIVEFIDGEICVTNADKFWQICTNDIVWKKSEEERDSFCQRYKTGSELAEKSYEAIDYPKSLGIIRSMSQGYFTMWTSVYTLTRREAHVLYRSRLETEFHDTIDSKNAN
jgi:hypothetical protein